MNIDMNLEFEFYLIFFLLKVSQVTLLTLFCTRENYLYKKSVGIPNIKVIRSCSIEELSPVIVIVR